VIHDHRWFSMFKHLSPTGPSVHGVKKFFCLSEHNIDSIGLV